MSGGVNTTKASTGSVSIGGQKLATAGLGANGYNLKLNLNPDQQKTWDTANKGIAGALGSISNVLATTPEQRAAFRDQLFSPVANQIRNSYGQAKDAAYARFNSIGGLNSLGFNRYYANQLAKNENTALSDALSKADVQSYQLPSMQLAPIAEALRLYQNGQGALVNILQGFGDRAMQGQSASGAYNNENMLWEKPQKGFFGLF